MSKYIELARIEIKRQLAWRGDVLMDTLYIALKILFAYLLWGIIYAENNKISGFTFEVLLSYYAISAFLSRIDVSEKISEEISESVRNGTFSKYLVLPMNVEGYFFSVSIGRIIIYLFFCIISVIGWGIVMKIKIFFVINPMDWIIAVIMVILGLVFMIQINYFFGILTLKFEDISTFLIIKNNLFSLVTGAVIPLSMFPSIITFILKCLPFYYISYMPSLILIGNCQEKIYMGIFVLMGWTLLMQVLISLTWNKYVKKYEGVGI